MVLFWRCIRLNCLRRIKFSSFYIFLGVIHGAVQNGSILSHVYESIIFLVVEDILILSSVIAILLKNGVETFLKGIQSLRFCIAS